MKRLLCSITIAALTIFHSATIATAQAPQATPKASPATHKTTNELAQETVQLFNEIYQFAATATDKASAQTAVTKINANIKKLLALVPDLKAAKLPTDKERKAFAKLMLEMDKELQASLKKLVQVMQADDEDTRNIISQALDSFVRRADPEISDALERLYPKKIMDKYKSELKAENNK